MEKQDELKFSIDPVIRNWHWIVLGIILMIGLGFRHYHVDYPVIGYHNWKDSRYLGEARNFARDGFFEHGFFVAAFDYPGLKSDPSGAHGGEFPSISVLIALIFMIFGESLYAAKLAMILINMGAVLVFYLLVRELFEREDLALASAFSAAMLPLLVFFSHNIQVVNLSLFFMLLGALFYVRWVKYGKSSDMILTSVFLMVSIIGKYIFVIIGIPMLFIIPYSRIMKDLSKIGPKVYPYAASMMIFLIIPLQYVYSVSISSRTSTEAVSSRLINISVMFTSKWWTTLKAYTADNYTIIGFFIAILGISFFLIFFQKKNIGHKFFIGYLAGTALYFIVMSSKLAGHSYHQYPVAPFFAFMIAYCFVVAASNISRIARLKYLKPAMIIIFFMILYFPSSAAWNRQFDTQFFGLDVAGDYIRENSAPDERIIHSGHQDYGVLWHADRKSTGGGIPSAEDIQWAEDNLNVRWIFMYQWGFSAMQDPEKWEYIKSNYGLAQIGILNNQPIYLLFRKGGSFNESMLQNLTGTQHQKTYELTKGTVTMQWVNVA